MISYCVKNTRIFYYSLIFVLYFISSFIPSHASQMYGAFEYDEINCDSRFCITKLHDKFGIIENTQESEYSRMSLPIEYDEIKQVITSSYNMYIVKKNGKYGLYLSMLLPFKEGFLLPVEFDEIQHIHNTLFFKLRKGNKYFLYYADQKQLSEAFDEIIKTKYGKYEYVITKRNNKYGIIGTMPHNILTNKTVPCKYDYIEPVNYHMAFKVKNDKGKYALYNFKTDKFTEFEYDDNFFENNGGNFFIIKKNGKVSLYRMGDGFFYTDKFIVKDCDSIERLKKYFPEVFKIKKGNNYAFYVAEKDKLSLFIYQDIKEDSSYRYFLAKNIYWHRERAGMDTWQHIRRMSQINKNNEYKPPKTKLIEIDETNAEIIRRRNQGY